MNYEYPERNHSFDNMRAVAAVLGITIHAAAGYLQYPITVWPHADQSSPVFDFWTWFLHMFRVPIFFFLAGYFAHQSFNKEQLLSFIQRKLFRIGLPFLIFSLLWNLPTLFIIVVFKPSLHKNELTTLFQNVGYLWFLEYLLVFYCITILLHIVFKQCPVTFNQKLDSTISYLLTSRGRLLILILLNTLLLVMMKVWFTPIFLDLTPKPFLLGIYALSYGLGWIFYKQKNVFEYFINTNSLMGTLTIGLLTYCLYFFLISGKYDFLGIQLINTLLYATSSWLIFVCFIRFFLNFFNRRNRFLKHIADASYWIYLIQTPLIIYFQSYFSFYKCSVFIKYFLTNGLVLIICLLTYQSLPLREKLRIQWH